MEDMYEEGVAEYTDQHGKEDSMEGCNEAGKEECDLFAVTENKEDFGKKEMEQNGEEKEEFTDDKDGDDDDDIDFCDLEDIEDIWDGEDPSEVEVERFCLPAESIVLNDLSCHIKKKRLLVYPLKISDLGHPTFVECIEKCSDFRTTYLQSHKAIPDGSTLWTGLVEMTFKTTFDAMEAVDLIKSMRDDIIVKQQEADESSTKKIIEKWLSDNANVSSVVPNSVKNMLVVKKLTENVRINQLKSFFPSAVDILLSKESLKSQSTVKKSGGMAYIFFNSEEELIQGVEKYSQVGIVADGVKLKLIPYQPPSFPYGLIKMKRRYKILMQIKELKKLIKEEGPSMNITSRNKVTSLIDQCQLIINKDNKARERVGLPQYKLSYLHHIPAIRESLPPDFDWKPQISYKTEDVEEGNFQRNDRKRSSRRNNRKNVGSNWRDRPQRNRREHESPRPPINPIARVHEIAAKIAKIASHIGLNQPGGDQQDRGRDRVFNRWTSRDSNSSDMEGIGRHLRSPERFEGLDVAEFIEGPLDKIARKEESLHTFKSSLPNRGNNNVPGPQTSQNVRPGWVNCNQPRFMNDNIPRGNPDQFNQGYNQPPVPTNTRQGYNQPPAPTNTRQGYNQPPAPTNTQPFSQSGYSQNPSGFQSSGQDYYNYQQNYGPNFSYPGYGYQPNAPWPPNQNSSYGWNNQSPQAGNYWPSSS